MILRRFAEALKEQNWASIWIEFVLLVAGVFLGIQVANWNEERVRNQQSAEFAARLREDVRNEAWNRAAIAAYHRNVLANARKSLSALEGKAAVSNEALVIAAYRASQYGELVHYRETYDELTSTGNVGLIKNRLLRKIATELYNGKASENFKNEGLNSRYREAFRMTMPIEVQDAIAKACGDRDLVIGEYKGLDTQLDYPCATGLPQEDIDRAAMTLRADPAFIQLLRLRIANVQSQLATVDSNVSEEVRRSLDGYGSPAP